MIRAIATMHRREMNRTEEQYAHHLEERRIVGEIRWWAYEAWKFRLADKTYYTPDFIVVDNALRIEAHEVKAVWQKAGKVGWEEDARVKIKCAAEIHPVRFLAVSRNRDGGWDVEEFLKPREIEPLPTEDKVTEKLARVLHWTRRCLAGMSKEELHAAHQVGHLILDLLNEQPAGNAVKFLAMFEVLAVGADVMDDPRREKFTIN